MYEGVAAILNDPGALAAAALLLVLLLAGAWVLLGSGIKRGNTILIAGPSGSGKTTLFYRLRDADAHNGTVISMEANEDTFPLGSEKGTETKPVRVVDVPGHPRLRHKLEQSASGVRGLVFLVDSADFMPHIRATAEYLFDVLSMPLLAKSRVPVLLGCNKSDLGAKAHTMDFIRKKLEKEVESLRGTRGALEGDRQLDIPLVNPAEPFTFANCKNKISISAISALKDDISAVESFIRSCVPAK